MTPIPSLSRESVLAWPARLWRRIYMFALLLLTTAAAATAASPIVPPPVGVTSPAGTLVRECSECPELVVVPAGSFLMGSDAPTPEGIVNARETPQHRVTFARPFAVGRFHVTRGEYAAFVQATGYVGTRDCYIYDGEHFSQEKDFHHDWRLPGFAQTDRDPVVCVSWNDAQAYIGWLNRRTGAGTPRYRMIDEAEYEYATRAGTTTRFPWGDDAGGSCSYKNSRDLTGQEVFSNWHLNVDMCRDGHVYTAPAGSYLPNRWGLYDMAGNVTHWLQDCWHDGYDGAPADGSAWVAAGCASHVARGSSWANPSRYGRSAGLREDIPPTLGSSEFGFRVVRTLE